MEKLNKLMRDLELDTEDLQRIVNQEMNVNCLVEVDNSGAVDGVQVSVNPMYSWRHLKESAVIDMIKTDQGVK